MEDAGGRPDIEKVSKHPMVVRALRDIEVGLARGGSGHVVRKAPQYAVLMVVALEHVVTDTDATEYRRVYAWFKLVRIWAALRFDDTLHIAPSDVSYLDGTLEVKIGRTKTTGPGKRVETLVAYVGPGAFVNDDDWLSEGFAVFRHLGAGVTRDYLLPMPNAELTGFKPAPVQYSDEMVLSRAMLTELMAPEASPCGGWLRGCSELLPPVAVGFWTVHSDRSVLATWGACLRLPKATLDTFGRWSTTGSAEYARSTKHVVVSAQSEIAGALKRGVSGPHLVGEVELLSKLESYLSEHGHSADQAREYRASLHYFGRGGAAPEMRAEPAAMQALEDRGAGPFAVDPLLGVSAGEPPLARPEQSGAESDDSSSVQARPSPVVDVAPEEYVYMVSTTARAQLKCLHMADGCYRARSYVFAECELYAALPPPASYTSVCKVCWRKSDLAMALSAGAGAGSEGDSDSSSSSVS